MARHPHKHIEAAIQYAVEQGWRFEKSQGHPFGRLKCNAGCCQFSVWSTPRNPESHARYIRREVDKCPAAKGE